MTLVDDFNSQEVVVVVVVVAAAAVVVGGGGGGGGGGWQGSKPLLCSIPVIESQGSCGLPPL